MTFTLWIWIRDGWNGEEIARFQSLTGVGMNLPLAATTAFSPSFFERFDCFEEKWRRVLRLTTLIYIFENWECVKGLLRTNLPNKCWLISLVAEAIPFVGRKDGLRLFFSS